MVIFENTLKFSNNIIDLKHKNSHALNKNNDPEILQDAPSASDWSSNTITCESHSGTMVFWSAIQNILGCVGLTSLFNPSAGVNDRLAQLNSKINQQWKIGSFQIYKQLAKAVTQQYDLCQQINKSLSLKISQVAQTTQESATLNREGLLLTGGFVIVIIIWILIIPIAGRKDNTSDD